MIILRSLRWRRPFYVGVLVGVGTFVEVSVTYYVSSEFLIFIPAMLLSAWGLALGSHLVVRDRVPPNLGRLIGTALTGGLAGALLFVIGLRGGVLLAIRLGLKLPEGLGWGLVFFPLWIFSAGGSAILGRYLGWRFLTNQMIVAVGTGILAALIGDTGMTLMIFRPFAVGPDYLHAPIAMTATFGALVAAGLAWAERKVPHGNAEAADTSLANDITGQ